MPINPNTDFVSGAVLNASEQNRFPRGIIQLATSTTTVTNSTTEAAYLTSPSFTAVANRYYKITYSEPNIQSPGGAGNFVEMRIRLTNASGTQLQYTQQQSSGATQTGNGLATSVITTLTAGATVIVGTLRANTGSPGIFRGSGNQAFLIIEDLGPA
jgi:hypothetical protein